MQVNEFIKDTVLAIAKGINDAGAELGQQNGLICPDVLGATHPRTRSGQPITMIKFDIALEVASGHSLKGDVSGNVFVAKANVEGEQHGNQSRTHRITFDLPVALPAAGNIAVNICKSQ